MKKGYQVIISLVVTAVLTVAVIMVETNEQKYVIRQDYITFAPFIFLMLITFALVVSIITIYISGKNVWQYIIAVVAAVISLVSSLLVSSLDSIEASIQIVSMLVSIAALCITNKTLRWLWRKYPDEE